MNAKKEVWNGIDSAPHAAVERWQAGPKVHLLLRCGDYVTIGYLERTRVGKKQWRSVAGVIVEPDGWMEAPKA